MLSDPQKFFAQFAVRICDNPFALAQFSKAVLAAQPFQHNADPVIGAVLFEGHAPDRSNGRFS
jgi:hypothetical protein